MKSVFFATDCIEDMHVWMQAMRQASTVQLPPGYFNSHLLYIELPCTDCMHNCNITHYAVSYSNLNSFNSLTVAYEMQCWTVCNVEKHRNQWLFLLTYRFERLSLF